MYFTGGMPFVNLYVFRTGTKRPAPSGGTGRERMASVVDSVPVDTDLVGGRIGYRAGFFLKTESIF